MLGRSAWHLAVAFLLACLWAEGQSRTILVTGASKGIGAAISAKFAEEGDRVVLHWRSNEAEAEAVRSRLAPSSEGAHICIQADLSQTGAPATLVQQAIRMVGSIDVLVCNHGMYEETPFESTSTLEFSQSLDRIMRVNLHAPAELVSIPSLMRACVLVDTLGAHDAAHRIGYATCLARTQAFEAAQHMIEGGNACETRGGKDKRIVFVSSRGARRGEPKAMAYGASKAALNSLTGSLAQALGQHGIGVSAVAPGFIETDMAKAVLRGPQGDAIRSQSSWGRVGMPCEVADAVFFLASSGAGWCSGTVLDCNGASYLH